MCKVSYESVFLCMCEFMFYYFVYAVIFILCISVTHNFDVLLKNKYSVMHVSPTPVVFCLNNTGQDFLGSDDV